ncbi:MAG: glucose-1-phosphate cytidylyltransferase [Cyanobacteria bacterium SID2]|nr:glucose-1-phosphate cytidylyltransferase [Cyanobacteria bacterium SID2]MBP0002626.1 glucose-1-phosphate cytidylyltransferase [Cyanobacteria bacterium SBC]
MSNIPVAILCGGKGTRLKEETEFRPKPMVTVGDRPMIWHIMKIYAHYGFTDFMLCLGYKGEMIREYFLNYDILHSNVLLELGSKNITKIDNGHTEENWKVWLIDTGQETMTGGRLKRLGPYLDKMGADLLLGTYGDGVCDVNITHLLDYHKNHGKLATITTVRPPSRFGELVIEDNLVTYFQEKPQTSAGWINGGYFVLSRKVLDLIEDDTTVFEEQPLKTLAALGELAVYKHDGFWQCMDTYRELEFLNKLYKSEQAKWKVW